MRCMILQHSTTGNTRLVARFAAERLAQAGWEVERWDIVKRPEPPDLTGVDLLGVASPTMYFRQTLAMERFIDRLPLAVRAPSPAFLIGTCSGMPGAHYPQQARQLAPKGWVVLGARWLIFPTNWPPHRRVIGPLEATDFVGASLGRWRPDLRPLLGLLWEVATVPTETDRDGLGRFVDQVAKQAMAADLSGAPAPDKVTGSPRSVVAMGMRMDQHKMESATRIQIDPQTCTRCGTCVGLCPVGCLTRAGEDQVPSAGDGCTGCWACYNHCPDRAIAGWFSPPGVGRYPGPSVKIRSLFRTSGPTA